MMGMTPKQAALLNFIKGYIAEKDYAPSYDEMATAIGIVAKSGINRYLNEMQERGLIRRRAGMSRTIEVLNPSDDMAFFETLPSGIRHIIRTIAIRERRTNESVMREWIRERAESFRTPYVEQLSA